MEYRPMTKFKVGERVVLINDDLWPDLVGTHGTVIQPQLENLSEYVGVQMDGIDKPFLCHFSQLSKADDEKRLTIKSQFAELDEKLKACYKALRQARRTLNKADSILAKDHDGLKPYDETWISDYIEKALDEIDKALGATQ